jgi:hypothetical protein
MSVTRPVIEFAGRRIAADIPHFIFATGVAAWVAWFCWDAWRAGPNIENLILIVPVSVLAMILYVVVVAGCFKRLDTVAAQHAPHASNEAMPREVAIKVGGSMVLLAVFVVAGPMLGFDIACFAYLLATIVLLGERRALVLLLVPLLFTAVVIYSFNTILSTPLPLFFGDHTS